jgi:Protein of unknown function, DUF481
MRWFFLLIGCFFSISMRAQISKSFSLGSSLNFGNLDAININFQSTIADDTGRWNWNVAPYFQYTMVRQNQAYATLERETFITSTMSRQYGKWKLIGFADMENSFLRKVLYRGAFGIGLGYTLVQNKNWRFTISEVLMPEFLMLENQNLDSYFSLRMSTRLKLKYSHKISFESITFLQPPIWTSRHISFLDNFNIRTINTLDVPVAKRLSLGVQFLLQISTLPAYIDPTVNVTDGGLSLFLKVTL